MERNKYQDNISRNSICIGIAMPKSYNIRILTIHFVLILCQLFADSFQLIQSFANTPKHFETFRSNSHMSK